MVTIVSPVGRMVQGSLYNGDANDMDGKPNLYTSGPNAGQPYKAFFFALAIAKGSEAHWSHTPWGKEVYDVGKAASPKTADLPSFAWKIEDGDSRAPNKKGRMNCDREGFPGHWVLKFSGTFAPKLYDRMGKAPVTTPDFCLPGDFIQVAFDCRSNNRSDSPGVYLNYAFVYFQAYHVEGRIEMGPNPSALGAGQAPLPPGASMTPAAAAPSAASITPPAAAPAAITPPTAALLPVPVEVAPAPAFLSVSPPPAAPARVMTAAAAGPYEAYISQGWTDAQLVQHGLMQPI